MSFVHGKGAFISINGVDITPYSDSVQMPRDIETSDTSHFGTQSKTYVSGMDDSKGTVAGLWDATLDTAIQTILSGQLSGTTLSVPVIYGPAGSATGKPRYTFNAIINQYDIQASAGDVVKFNIGLQRTGSTTTDAFV